jgi:hypothetical protein
MANLPFCKKAETFPSIDRIFFPMYYYMCNFIRNSSLSPDREPRGFIPAAGNMAKTIERQE